MDYMVYKHTIPVIENNPNINEILIFEEKYRQSKWDFFKFLLQIRKRKYDIVIDVYGKIESNLMVLFSGADKKIGLYKKRSSFLFTDTVLENYSATSEAGAAIDNRLNLLSPLQPKIALDNKPKIFLTEKEIQNGKEVLLQNNIDFSKKIFMISIVGSEVKKNISQRIHGKSIGFHCG